MVTSNQQPVDQQQGLTELLKTGHDAIKQQIIDLLAFPIALGIAHPEDRARRRDRLAASSGDWAVPPGEIR